ncbi:hypothetical protein COLO4_25021 [Corchorus olitorius]|uniref:Uncharacterized protein n=1 Tax=Corchorus olitorius TaxID=93759 RepID=A0A1R3I563_9ROSI|nr:hypothetical protein COLO4_25021 [Corchorus olitorius]
MESEPDLSPTRKYTNSNKPKPEVTKPEPAQLPAIEERVFY